MPVLCSARNSRAGSGRANFMGAWDFFGSFCWKTTMPIKILLVGGGGGVLFFRRNVEVPIWLLWARGFSERKRPVY